MRRFTGSLYAHLALVLLVALGASYATMYLLFLSHLEETRNSNFARSIATQVRLVEELLRSTPAAAFPSLNGIKLARTAPTGPVRLDPEIAHRLPYLKKQLNDDLGREVEIVPITDPVTGLWVDLDTPPDQPQWMFITLRKPELHRGGPLLPALLVGFAVFMGGGMLLLWQIQRPLKRLGKALEAVGQSRKLAMLPVTGSGEIRMLAASYNNMAERLQRYEEDRATMLAGVAHDLRTPITRLRLLMELAQNSRSGDMLKNLDDIERITEQFLVYARGNDDEPFEQRDLKSFLEEIAAPYAMQGVSAVCEADEIILSVRANSLRRALINLIENAIEYGSLPIFIRTAQGEDYVTIAVEDAGSGIPPEEIPRALRPFSRLDSSRGGKGHCGLGLVIASRIAEDHHGALELRNREGGGFVAEIRLPRASGPRAS